jgi:hypothetical protein
LFVVINADGLFEYGASTTHYGHHRKISKSTHTISPTLFTFLKENVVISTSIQSTLTTTQLEVDSEVASRKCTPESVGNQTYQAANLCESPLFAATISCIGKTELHSATT